MCGGAIIGGRKNTVFGVPKLKKIIPPNSVEKSMTGGGVEGGILARAAFWLGAAFRPGGGTFDGAQPLRPPLIRP